MKETTRLINLDSSHNEVSGKPLVTINPPLYHASTVLFERCEDLYLANTGSYEGATYGTDRLPLQTALEEAITGLEGGELTRAFQSGLAAITHTFFAYADSGDHILVCDNVYGPGAHFCRKVLPRFNIEVEFVPSAIGADIADYLRPNTRMIFLESPGSNTFEIQDIPAITRVARERGIITVIDNTWATPLYLKPLALGVDIAIHSVTKYISGHSDLLMGTITANQQYAGVLADYYRCLEIYASADDCYRALRGIKTLGVRLCRHETSALEMARRLESIDLVESVIHPALPSHPQHEIWKRDFTGSTGLFAFTFKSDYSDETIAAFVNALGLFGIGYSWGGFKSLITVGRFKRRNPSLYAGKNMVRLNIGLEDTQDLMDDLEQAFTYLK
ncbi:MAG: cystathionine beta-lyase [Candidatus Sedimenticola sp. (ex Thyasira tokunagai)]